MPPRALTAGAALVCSEAADIQQQPLQRRFQSPAAPQGELAVWQARAPLPQDGHDVLLAVELLLLAAHGQRQHVQRGGAPPAPQRDAPGDLQGPRLILYKEHTCVCIYIYIYIYYYRTCDRKGRPGVDPLTLLRSDALHCDPLVSCCSAQVHHRRPSSGLCATPYACER